jgi:hypothetical protein
VLKCKSSGEPSTGPKLSYVINGGVNDSSTGTHPESSSTTVDKYSVKYSAAPTKSLKDDGTTSCYGVKIDEIKSTTKTMIISENLQAGNWSLGLTAAPTTIEQDLAFTYGLDEDVEIKAINVGLDGAASNSTARPSSNHPAVVIAGFADGGARRVNESIGYDVYIKLCMPSSSNIDTADLGW